MKTLELTDRAKQKGVLELDLNHYQEKEGYATGVIHERKNVTLDQKEAKRTKQKSRVDDIVYPVIIFNSNVKHADYDRAKRFLEKSGLILPLPDPSEFRTELYNINLGKYQNVLRGWGYDSGMLPPTKRWDPIRIANNSALWVADNQILAEIIFFTVSNMYVEYLEDGSFTLEEDSVLIEKIKTEFDWTALF